MENNSQVDPRNKLNSLTGKEWIRFTKSWFIADGKASEISREIELHPASFPPEMIQEFIEFFTKPGQRVLDPFVGTGSTLVACDQCERVGVGIELYERYVNTAQSRTSAQIYHGDSRERIEKLVQQNEKFALCITSPPYWQILTKHRDYNQKERKKKGLDLQYGNNPKDLGLISERENFLQELVQLFLKVKMLLTERGHLIIFVQNVREKGELFPLAFELALRLGREYRFLGEKIWLQNQKVLRPYGMPYSFVPNIHHHYSLIFQKR